MTIKFDLDFSRNRFRVSYLRSHGWVFREGANILSVHNTYEEAEKVWVIHCTTIVIEALS